MSEFLADLDEVLRAVRAGTLQARLTPAAYAQEAQARAEALNALLQQLEKTTINKETYAKALRQTLQEQDDLVTALTTFRRFGHLLTSNVPLPDLCQQAVRIIVEELDIENCSILLANEERSHLRLAAAFGQADRFRLPSESKTYNSALSIEMGVGIAGQVALSRLPRFVADVRADESFALLSSRVPLTSILSLPLVADDELIGVLNLSHADFSFLTKQHERFFTITADLLANLLRRCQLAAIIEERRRLELNQAMRREALLDQAAHEYVLLLDASGTIVYSNTMARRYLGQGQADLVGLRFGDLPELHATSVARHETAVDQVKNGVPAAPYEVELRLPSGPVHIIEFRLTVAGRAEDGSVNVLAVGRDVTERKLLEAQVLRAEKLASIGTLAAGIAHEILNPLHIISMSTQLLGQDDRDPEVRKESYGSITRQVDRIAKIVRGIKSFAQQQGPKTRAISLLDVVDQAVDLLAHEFRSHGIQVSRDLARTLPPVLADYDQIMQVLVNLFTNARDAMPHGGALTISPSLATLRGEPMVRLQITDTGTGIPPEVKDRIFDPFFTTKDLDKGTGLGLSICHGIIAEHRGELVVESTVGKGTTVTVALPLAESLEP